jgi:hypothetical protein
VQLLCTFRPSSLPPGTVGGYTIHIFTGWYDVRFEIMSPLH